VECEVKREKHRESGFMDKIEIVNQWPSNEVDRKGTETFVTKIMSCGTRLPMAVVVVCSTLTIGAAGFCIGNVATASQIAGDPVSSDSAALQEQETEDTEQVPDSEQPEFDLAANLESFDKVWETIDSTHWDEEMVGQKWDDAKAKYRPQVEAAKSIKEVRQAMEDLIKELGQSHFGVIPADAYDVVGEGGGQADAGLTFRLTEDGVLVSKVRKDSSAEKAGIGPGWALDKIQGKEIAEISEKIQKAAHGPIRFETLTGLALSRLASGDEGETIEVVLRDGDGETKTMELELETPPGKIANFGNLPPIFVASDVRTLDGEVGYFGFSAFFEPQTIMPAFRKMLRDENHSNGIVIDLRGNIGGIAGMTMGMASMFASEKAELGVMRMRAPEETTPEETMPEQTMPEETTPKKPTISELKFVVNENYDPVTCPVAVLVDECSISSAEILSGGLQDLKLARIFGSRTAGLALPSMVIKLPNGDGFQYAFADYKSASGKSLEKDGVVPNEVVTLSRDLLLRDADPVLNRALEWIKQQNQKSEK